MKKHLLILIGFAITGNSYSQIKDTTKRNDALNSANTLLVTNQEKKLNIGMYAQLDYNQQFGDTLRHNGLVDVHRLVIFMGYKFNSKTDFVTEIEFEHVNEAAVEQAFLNYKLAKWIDVRAGLMLIPMGIINEYHEPTTFNGTSRPNLDNKIVPTTWRELGAGFSGKLDAVAVKYQLYAVNGFNGYDTGGKFKGDDGLRGGRQKGIKSYITRPDYSAKLDYYGIRGLKIGAAGYFGDSESKLYEGLEKSDTLAKAELKADSSSVGITMIGFDVRY